ncbi:Scr1 family TA system antitoxin-like transcriptional regulator [Actinomadura miaoliensis]|uniref:Helix-turn-helix domain-containing protein n=1 Tax=Actinomadura miaoliensis TaxID=430685 RepID=A0ABP7WSB7_9ACTN
MNDYVGTDDLLSVSKSSKVSRVNAGKAGEAMTFGERLRELMADRGVGIRELAREVPCDSGHLSRVANGRKPPSEQLAERLYLEKPHEIERYTLAFDHLRAAALRPSDSQALIARVADEMSRTT